MVKKPPDQQVINSKWVFKQKSNGKYKARLVACGNETENNSDQVYAPVARAVTVKTFLSVINELSLYAEQLHVQSAFLHGYILDPVYMRPPPGQPQDKVCKLHKSIYGLPKSPRCWNERFTKFMKSKSFVQSENDPCLFTNLSDKVRIYVLIYVDDIIISSNDLTELACLKDSLIKEFRMTYLGKVEKFLGIEVFTKENILSLSQTTYITELTKRFNIDEDSLYKTPMETNLNLDMISLNAVDQLLPYRELIGALLFITTCTRPDISYAVNFLSRYQHAYNITHYRYALRVLKYLNTTKNLRLSFIKNRSSVPIILYSDADWASDKIDRKSTSGAVLEVFGNFVNWFSRKQRIVALSSTESKYISLTEGVKEAIWLQRLLVDFGFNILSQPIVAYEDNVSAIYLVKDPSAGSSNGHTKHIDIRYHFIRIEVMENRLILKSIKSSHQPADLLTKSLKVDLVKKHRLFLNIV